MILMFLMYNNELSDEFTVPHIYIFHQTVFQSLESIFALLVRKLRLVMYEQIWARAVSNYISKVKRY